MEHFIADPRICFVNRGHDARPPARDPRRVGEYRAAGRGRDGHGVGRALAAQREGGVQSAGPRQTWLADSGAVYSGSR